MGMFGTKAGMTQIFTPEGLSLPATVIALENGNVVTQVHTEEKSGYNAVQIGYQECAERKVTRPEAGHCKKAGANAMRHLREFKVHLQLSPGTHYSHVPAHAMPLSLCDSASLSIVQQC